MSRGEMEATAVADLLTRLSFYNEARDYEERMAWERVRLQTIRIVALFAKRGSGLTPEKFWPLPWDRRDEEVEVREMTPEEKEESLKKLLAIDQGIWQQKQD